VTRRFEGGRLVVATHNPDKLRELAELLAPFGAELVGAAELGLGEPRETGTTFADNARLKALAAARASGLLALADDSGLSVAGLGGAPGIHSARWAGPRRDFQAAMRRVRDGLVSRFGDMESADRRAAFVAALCLAWPDGVTVEVLERVRGLIVWPPRGEGGFGYDPIFEVDGRTFAETTPEEKHALGHRGKALRALVEAAFAAG
jgi:XTP/dITP diphosphohydrolase